MYSHLSFQCFVSQQFEAIDFKTSFESQKKNKSSQSGIFRQNLYEEPIKTC